MPRYLLIITILILSGCQPVTVQHAEDGLVSEENLVSEEGLVPVSIRVDDTAYWLEDWYRVVQLPDVQVQAILKIRENEFANSPNPRTRLRLVLLLAQGPKLVRDQPRAYKLLKAMDKKQSDKSALALASLLEQVIGERRWVGDKTAELRAALKQSKDRTEELERQLQALTNIEQNIQFRD